jgi:tetraacyldisaccharide 4'-kinase
MRLGFGGPIGVVSLASIDAASVDLSAPARDLGALRNEPVLAVASLADPRPFFQDLRNVGAVVEELTFPDHHTFTRREVDAVIRQAAGRVIVTTRKEAVNLRPLLPPEITAMFLRQTVVLERGRPELDQALKHALGE